MGTPDRGTVARLLPFGESVFTRMSRLAAEHNAVNLGQGFPNFDGPDFVKQAACRAIEQGHGQYARMSGLPELNQVIATRFRLQHGVAADPDRQVTVTSGCTEAIAATMLGLVEPGDEVVLVEPFYDSYPATVAMAGGTVRTIRMRAPDFAFPVEDLRRAVGPRTRLILINSPHNPTGRVLDQQELAAIAEIASRVGCLVVSDEVYEHIWFERPHRSIVSLPGMSERTIVLSSLGKTFSLTGWKIGWAVAPVHLTAGIRAAHQFLTFAAATPLQHAAVAALQAPPDYFDELRADYAVRRKAMLEALQGAGLQPWVPQGAYFMLCDHTRFGFPSDEAFCEHLIRQVGVAAIPCSPFHADPAGAGDLVRFAFCKDLATIHQAAARLKAGLQGLAAVRGS